MSAVTTHRPSGDAARTSPSEEEVARYARTRDARLRAKIVASCRRLVEALAAKFARRGAPVEDLIQVASIGLVQALDRFDPDRGVKFTTYAINNMVGEIKHYFRDFTWVVKVPRRLQERSAAMQHAEEELRRRNGSAPMISELAEFLNLSEEQIVEAMEMGYMYRPFSLDSQVALEDEQPEDRLADLIGREDHGLTEVVEHASLRRALDGLDTRKQWILRRRYFDDWSQSEVGQALGISQMHVSRLEREALKELRAAIASE
ncbi:MAG: SigB/SigF/SigG family RNA polymerase sigma factor [Armatimonadetes bacterium]|nr:SigB/SigF/SigG family RNA polymerase sigma factor [Armatimonadota bacterium]